MEKKMETQKKIVIRNVEYDVCGCCGKPKAGTGKYIGGVAIFVTKSFVRDKKIVDFPGDWQRLCESVGFKTLHIHHAMLVKERKLKTLFGHTHIEKI